jgi:multicomponent Na+:H+ antiporter subunit E
MLQILLLSLPISLIWIGVTGQVSPGGFLVGYIVGVLTLLLLSRLGIRFEKTIKPTQPLAFLTYTWLILWNGLSSSVQVVKLVLSPKIELKTGIVALSTGDKSKDQQLAALSAHGINMTPGQLVIDFDDGGTLYIHCLDLEASRPHLEAEQARRTRLLRRIMGVNDDE